MFDGERGDTGDEDENGEESQPRSGSGLFDEEYPNKAFIEAVAELSPARTSEVAEIVGCDHETARLRWETLADVWELERRRLEVGEWSA